MSHFLGSGAGKVNNTQTPATGLRIQTAIAGTAIPLVCGQIRVAGTLIDYDDFKSTGGQQSGGKGGVAGSGGKGDSSGSVNYQTTVIIGIAEGPLSAVIQVWNNQTAQTLASLNLTAFLGTYTQNAWGFMTSKHPAKALNYRGLAYVAAAPLQLGSSPNLPNLSYEVLSTISGAISGVPDANPGAWIQALLTDPNYGLGFPSARLGDLSLYSGWCQASGLFVSDALTGQRALGDYLKDLLEGTYAEFVFVGGQLTAIPRGMQALTANGATYTPRNPAYTLSADDFLPNTGAGGGSAASSSLNQDPVVWTRIRRSDAYNQVTVNCLDRSNAYNPNPQIAYDQGSIQDYAVRPMDPKGYNFFCLPSAALTSAHLLLEQQQILNTCTFTLGMKYALLSPMDLLAGIPAPSTGDTVTVNVIEITQNDDLTFTVLAEEYPSALVPIPAYGPGGAGGFIPNYNEDPGPINPPVIFEPAGDLTGGAPEVWIGASGTPPLWGGADVYLSVDNTSYGTPAARITQAARQGVLTAALPAFGGDDADTTSTLAIDLSASGAVLDGAQPSDADAGRTLAYVDGEILAFGSVTPTGTVDHYNLTYLRRGLYGTAATAHATGTQFLRLDGAVLRLALPANEVGVNLWAKFRSVNLYGGGEEDLSAVTAYEYLTTGNGSYIAPPTAMTITSNSRTQSDGTNILALVFAWTASPGPLLDHYEVEWKTAADTGWPNSRIVGGNSTSTTLDTALANTTYSARVRAISQTGYPSEWDNAADTGSGELWDTVPVAPNLLTAVGGLQSITLTWAPNPETNIQAYWVFSAEGDDANPADAALVAAVFATTWTHSNLGFGETRSYWLEAVNVAGESLPSNRKIATTIFNFDGSNIVNVAEDALADSLATKIDTSSAAATNVGTIQETIASLIQLVDTAIGTATASVQDEAETRANADGSVMAERTIKVQALSDGRQAIAGIGLIAEASGESTQSEVLILANRFVVASVNEDGSVVALAPFVIDSGNAYFTGKVYMNDLVTADVTTPLLEIHPPSDGSGGLKVYANDGTGEKLVFDPTHGLGIGQATPVYTVSLTSSVSIGAMGTVISLPTQSYYGRAALVFVDIQTNEVHFDGGLQNVTLYVQVDGTTVSSIVVTSGQAASESFLLLPAKLSAAEHTVSLALSSEAGDSGPTTVTASNLSVLDFKA